MKKLLWLPLLLLTAVALAPAASNAAAEKEVLAAMNTWKQAAMKKDRALFDKTLHADLTYGHSNGLVETKQDSIDHIVNSKVIYQAVNFSDTKVRVHGDTAFVTGKVDFHQKTGDTVNVINLVVLTAWVKGPQGWQMIARQSTRPAPPAQP
jgi:ketosteroid isomerase-like protein